MDVMNNFETVSITDAYVMDNNEKTNELPFTISLRSKKLKIKIFKGWQSNIQGINSFEALPEQARNFLNAIRILSKTKISYLSYGPGRDELIIR